MLTREDVMNLIEEHDLYTLNEIDINHACTSPSVEAHHVIGWHADYAHEARCDARFQREHEQNYL